MAHLDKVRASSHEQGSLVKARVIGHDDALLRALAPDQLAAAVDPSERVAYLREMLSNLGEELIERSFEVNET